MRFMWLTHTDTRTYNMCVRMLNKMAAMVIDKFHSQLSVLLPVHSSLSGSVACYCPANGRHFAYTLKEIDDALKDSSFLVRD